MPTAGDYQAMLKIDFQRYADQAELVPTVWGLYGDKASVGPRLQYHYTRRHLCDSALLNIAEQVDVSRAGVQRSNSQHTKHLQDMRAASQAEIDVIERRQQANRPPQVAQLTTNAPAAPFDPMVADPTDTRYIGDPLKRPFTRP